MSGLKSLGLTVLALLAGTSVASAAGPTQYTLVKTVDLPGAKGGHGDWVTFDQDTRTVWLAQAPNHNVIVIDAKTNAIKKVIEGVEEGNGIALGAKEAFVADGKGNNVVVFDKRNFAKLATLDDVGKNPDGVYWDARTHELWVAADDDNQLTLFKAGKKGAWAKVTSFKLEPNPAKDGPDVGVLVAARGRIYQPVDNKVDVIDLKGRKVEAMWDPGVKEGAKSIAYDPKTGHLVMGTTDGEVMVLDAGDGKLVATIKVDGKVDEAQIDTGARRAYLGDKAGHVDVIDLDTNMLVTTIPSDKDMHTLTVDPKTHTVYVYRDQANKVDVFSAK